ncbi:MAG TPA: amino acid racemase [Rhizomicrobium sp.]|nr:amino acid racemase [Rhizomicrobium sp.]
MHRGEKIVGVIGGMGPEATVDFLRRLIAATPAHDDKDHLHVLVDNNPKIPSRIAALIEGMGEDPAPVLCEMAKGLERQGADFLVVPCNTAHHYLPQIACSVEIPLLDMVDLSVKKLLAADTRPRRIGLLASPAVRLVGLYSARFEQAGLQALYPEQPCEDALLGVIKAVKAGQLSDQHRKDYATVAAMLDAAGAEAFLIACTELSIIGPPDKVNAPVIDTLDLLVEATIATARQ